MRLPVALLLSALLLAGCVSVPEEPVAPQAADLVDALAALEAGEPSANLRVVAEWLEGNAAEAAAWGDFVYVDHGKEVVVLNVSDAQNVTVAGSVTVPGTILDVKVSDDGAFLFVGDDQEASGALGGTGPLTGGFYAIDIRDLSAPEVVAYQPIGERRGPHMVFYHRHPDGREILYGANADVSIVEFDREAGAFRELSRYAPDLVFGFNRDPQVFDALYQGWAHDMFVMSEPNGQVLMYVANWDAGLRVVDVTDPAQPKELGGWNAFPDGHEGNLHTVSTAWIGEPGCGPAHPAAGTDACRRISVGAVEVGFAVVGGYHYAMGTDANVVYVWDTTDPANIALLGEWQNPVEPYSKRDRVEGDVTSTHNLQLEDGRIYLAHYGMGVYVLDVSTPEAQAAPPILAYWQHEDMSVWDVVLHQGVAWATGTAGVVGLHYLPDVLGEAGLTSRA